MKRFDKTNMQKKDVGVQRSQDVEALHAACKREGCPVCTVLQAYIQRQMDTWQYEGFTDVEHRQGLIRSRGFCPLHTWQLAQLTASFQLAVIYQEVLSDMLAALEREQRLLGGRRQEGRDTKWRKWWRRWSARPATSAQGSASTSCPFCQNRAKIEQRLVSTLVENLRSEEGQAMLCQSTGLCQVHFSQARHRAEVHDPEGLARLFACQRMCMERVQGELQELLRKHDYRFAGETGGNEMTSWRRAAELCAGNPGIR